MVTATFRTIAVVTSMPGMMLNFIGPQVRDVLLLPRVVFHGDCTPALILSAGTSNSIPQNFLDLMNLI